MGALIWSPVASESLVHSRGLDLAEAYCSELRLLASCSLGQGNSDTQDGQSGLLKWDSLLHALPPTSNEVRGEGNHCVSLTMPSQLLSPLHLLLRPPSSRGLHSFF